MEISMNTQKSSPKTIFQIAILITGIACLGAEAAVINVTTSSDDVATNGNCTLREAIQAANTNTAVDACASGNTGLDQINIPAGSPYVLTIPGTGEDLNQTGDLDVLEAVDLVGSGTTVSIIDGNDLDRVLHILNAAPVSITQLTISGGRTSGFDDGGGIWSDGDLSITKAVVSDNTAVGGGGGIVARGSLSVSDSTISLNAVLNDGFGNASGGGISVGSGVHTITNTTINNNFSNSDGGGISIFGGTVTISNSTISNNGALESGGGIEVLGVLNLINSTITKNSSAQPGGGIWISGRSLVNLGNSIVANQLSGGDCSAPVTTTLKDMDSDGSCNVGITSDPLLGPLADNGGPTRTHAIAPGSPAIDAGDGSVCPLTDQRGISRPQGSACDIGAYEYKAAPAVPIPALDMWMRALLILLLPTLAFLLDFRRRCQTLK